MATIAQSVRFQVSLAGGSMGWLELDGAAVIRPHGNGTERRGKPPVPDDEESSTEAVSHFGVARKRDGGHQRAKPVFDTAGSL
jgi:hypothetical protein